MRGEGLLDLDNRKGKAPGGYCTDFLFARRPFIFANSVGVHDDVQTLLHEGGHAFHVFESSSLPYYPQQQVPIEFAEVASMSMELLASPYLTADQGGFYTPAGSCPGAHRVHGARPAVLALYGSGGRIPALGLRRITPSPATRLPATHNGLSCGSALCLAWIGLDWTMRRLPAGSERVTSTPTPSIMWSTGWLCLAQCRYGAIPWQTRPGAVAAYRKALALGYTVPLPQLYAAAGARFAFDAAALRQAVDLMLETINALEK